MKKISTSSVGSSLILAMGLVVACLVTLASEDSGMAVLSGPLILAGCMVLAGFREQRVGSKNAIIIGCIMAGCVMLASTLIAFSDPTNVASFIPILGSGGIAIFAKNATDCRSLPH